MKKFLTQLDDLKNRKFPLVYKYVEVKDIDSFVNSPKVYTSVNRKNTSITFNASKPISKVI